MAVVFDVLVWQRNAGMVLTHVACLALPTTWAAERTHAACLDLGGAWAPPKTSGVSDLVYQGVGVGVAYASVTYAALQSSTKVQ